MENTAGYVYFIPWNPGDGDYHHFCSALLPEGHAYKPNDEDIPQSVVVVDLRIKQVGTWLGAVCPHCGSEFRVWGFTFTAKQLGGTL